MQIIPWLGLSYTMNSSLYSLFTIYLRPPADLYLYIIGEFPTGARQESDVSGY